MSVKCNCGETLPLTTAGPAHVCNPGASEEARQDDPLDPETEQILQFVACDIVQPRSPYRGSYHLTCALRSRIRELVEEARNEGRCEMMAPLKSQT